MEPDLTRVRDICFDIRSGGVSDSSADALDTQGPRTLRDGYLHTAVSFAPIPIEKQNGPDQASESRF